VWIVYGFGIFAGAIFFFSALFTLGALVLSNDVPVSTNVSTPAIVLWGGLIVAAVATWIVRRRQRR
jgi:LPXTG-motif cell wall-anchored protein